MREQKNEIKYLYINISVRIKRPKNKQDVKNKVYI